MDRTLSEWGRLMGRTWTLNERKFFEDLTMPKGIPGRAICIKADCTSEVRGHGLCNKHYITPEKQSPEERRENNAACKLTEEEVGFILHAAEERTDLIARAKKLSNKDIAAMFGIHENTVKRVIYGETWKDVDPADLPPMQDSETLKSYATRCLDYMSLGLLLCGSCRTNLNPVDALVVGNSAFCGTTCYNEFLKAEDKKAEAAAYKKSMAKHFHNLKRGPGWL